MTCPEFIREALSEFANCYMVEDAFAVPTQCLYPSNGVVTVYLRGGKTGCVVSDEGQSISEIRSHGLEVPRPENFLRQFCRPRGLRIENAKIFTTPMPPEGLPSAISLVATVSSLAAYWGVHNLTSRPRRDLRKELRSLLGLHFSVGVVKEELKLAGLSGREYRFDFVIELGHERRLVVDAVTPDAPTINARAVAHFDVARTENQNLLRRLVYDETDPWQASDISLLRMAGELVPLSRFERNIAPLWSHA